MTTCMSFLWHYELLNRSSLLWAGAQTLEARLAWKVKQAPCCCEISWYSWKRMNFFDCWNHTVAFNPSQVSLFSLNVNRFLSHRKNHQTSGLQWHGPVSNGPSTMASTKTAVWVDETLETWRVVQFETSSTLGWNIRPGEVWLGWLVGLGWLVLYKPPAPLGCDPTSLGWKGSWSLVGWRCFMGLCFFWDDEGVKVWIKVWAPQKNRKKLVHRCS